MRADALAYARLRARVLPNCFLASFRESTNLPHKVKTIEPHGYLHMKADEPALA